jgi:hypothetical protein
VSKKKGKRKRNRQGGDTSMDNVVPFQPNQEDTEVLVTEEPVAVAEEPVAATEEPVAEAPQAEEKKRGRLGRRKKEQPADEEKS